MTATSDGSPGASAREMAARHARAERLPLLFKSAGAGVAGGALAGWLLGWVAGLGLGLLLALGLGLVLRRRGAAARWRLGARGEWRTARRLNRLRRHGWHVWHDLAIPGSRANVDHLLVGAGGVVLVDSKVRRGAVRIGGGDWVRIGSTGGPLLVRSTLGEAAGVGRVLSAELGRQVWVTPVLAVHTAKLPPWRRIEVRGVPIMAARHVAGWITSRPAELSPGEVTAAAAAVRNRLPPYSGR